MQEENFIQSNMQKDQLEDLYNKLCEIVGAENVSNEKFVRLCYSRDSSSIPGKLPDIVARPSTTDEVREILLLANETSTPVYTRGSGSGLWGGCIPYKGGIVLDCAGRLNKFIRPAQSKTMPPLYEIYPARRKNVNLRCSARADFWRTRG